MRIGERRREGEGEGEVACDMYVSYEGGKGE